VDPTGLQTTDFINWENVYQAWNIVLTYGPFAVFDKGILQDDRRQAESEAKKSGFPGLHDGPGDAFRHCVWSCLMTRDVGESMAAFIGRKHEEYEGPTENEKEIEAHNMDLANNALGRMCGLAGSKGSCPSLCTDALMRGNLSGLTPEPSDIPLSFWGLHMTTTTTTLSPVGTTTLPNFP
jgi:hypothetical protein